MTSDNPLTDARDEIASVLTPPHSKAVQDNPRVGSFLLSWLARFAGLMMLALSGYMFYRFAENDWGMKVLASAFALCFGAGSLAYGPLFIMGGLMARSRKTPTKRQAVWVLALSLPWLCAGGVLLTYSNMMRYAGIVAIGLSLLFTFWAFRHLARFRRERA